MAHQKHHKTVRTRIAPSPTGDPHVGTAYVALFNLCFARQYSGKFVLRIEDTDQARSTDESEQSILDALKWLGLNWDEGPDIGGSFGPYRQSERKDIYRQYALELVDKGHAFYCFRTPEELDAIRDKRKSQGLNPGIKGNLELSKEEIQSRLDAGDPYVIRMKVPDEGTCNINDMLRGNVTFDWSQIDCQILLKSDGMPTYHLANVVDDHLMDITHILRGEEWLNSAPKHQLLYQYFGWDMPELCHLPLLRNPDKTKLSKRKNPTSINFYESMGFLPEAVVNYLGRMGWSMPDEQEKFTLDEMIDNFDITRISLGGPVFDVQKLRWLNGLWLREEFTDEQLIQRMCQWRFNKDTIQSLIPHIKGRIDVFSDISPMINFMFSGMLELTADDFKGSKLDHEEIRKILQFTLWKLENQRHWNKENIFQDLKTLSKSMNLKMKDFMFPIFVAISGTSNSWSVIDSMVMLGPDMTRSRLRNAVHMFEVSSDVSTEQLEYEFLDMI